MLIAALALVQPQNLITDPGFARLQESWSAAGTPMQASGSVLILQAKQSSQPWDVNAHARLNGPVPGGQTAVLRLRMRSERPLTVGIHLERSGEPYDKVLSGQPLIDAEWQDVVIVSPTQNGFGAGEAQISLHLGSGTGRVEIASIDLRVFAEPPANVRTAFRVGAPAPSEAWKKEAAERIRRVRRAPLRVRVVDAQGRPVAGAEVKVRQQRHAFRFGTAVVPDRLLGSEPDDRRYQAELSRLFNTAVLENDFKWADYARPELGRQAADRIHQLGLQHRGHVLIWGGWGNMPGGSAELPVEELRRRMLERAYEAVKATQGKLYAWDVVNEPMDNWAAFEKAGEDLFPAVFREARRADPNVRLVLNDYNLSQSDTHTDNFLRRARQLQQAGAPLDALGDQAHMGAPFLPLERVWAIWDRIHRESGLPIEITEFDAAIPNDAEHGAYVRDFLTAAFAHPAVDTFMIWGWWARHQWRGADAAMVRDDWSPRPAMQEYERLVFRDWWTSKSGRTDRTGAWRLEPFKGLHRVSAAWNGRTAEALIEVGQGLDEAVIRLPR